MEDDDRGWPLGEAQIRAKYHALVRRDLERKTTTRLAAQAGENLGYDQMLDPIPVTLPKSRSTREAYSRARSLQRVLRRAGLTDTSGKCSQSVPVSSPSSLDPPNSRAPSLLSRVESPGGVVGPSHHVLALDVTVDVPKPTVSAPSCTSSQRPTRSEIYGKQTKFLAKQFTMISNSNTAAPRRNIKILGKVSSPSDDARGTTTIVVAGKVERNELQERIRVHDCGASNGPESSVKSVAPGTLPAEDDHQSLRVVDSMPRSPESTAMLTTSPSSDNRYSDHAHANSPSSVISDVVSEASIPETVLSSLENEPTGRRSKLTVSNLTSFSNTRHRWTSRELFGSFDFGGELDIDQTIIDGRNGSRYANHEDIPDSSESSWNLDGSMDSPSSGMRSPRQSPVISSQGEATNHDRGRVEHRGVHSRRMKVTSPSSLFRDGPWYNVGDDHRKPRREQSSSPSIPRKFSRKLSTSFNKRRKQVQPDPPPRDHAESQQASLSTRSPVILKAFNGRNATVREEPFKGSLTLEIASLLSGFKVTAQARSRTFSNGRVSNNSVISQQEATTAFQDDIAQLMLDRSESNEIGDIEEFLDGYMRLRSPFYLEVVEEFFRTVSYDCYRRPLGVAKLPPKVPHR